MHPAARVNKVSPGAARRDRVAGERLLQAPARPAGPGRPVQAGDDDKAQAVVDPGERREAGVLDEAEARALRPAGPGDQSEPAARAVLAHEPRRSLPGVRDDPAARRLEALCGTVRRLDDMPDPSRQPLQRVSPLAGGVFHRVGRFRHEHAVAPTASNAAAAPASTRPAPTSPHPRASHSAPTLIPMTGTDVATAPHSLRKDARRRATRVATRNRDGIGRASTAASFS